MPIRRIACAQVEARDLADAPRALDEALAMVAAAGDAGADLCVLPEGTYPAYVLGSADAGRAALAAGPDAVTRFGAAAHDAGLDLVVGLVLDSPDGLLNAALHFGPDGEVRARAAKQLLWHFDNEWFAPGGPAPVSGGVGMLVCADGRLPEIAGGLVERGATLIVNSTAWVTSLPPPEGSNMQAEFLWRVRALERGVAAAAATKVGTESGVAMYSGRSQIVAADGTVIAMASPTEPELLVADVDVPDVATPPAADAEPAGAAAGGADLAEPRRPPLVPGFAYVVVLSHGDLAGSLVGHGANLVVHPDGSTETRELPVDAVVLRDDALLVPGPARRAALAGAAIVVWHAARVSSPYVEVVARARALENRVFVVVWRHAEEGGAFAVDPSGRVVARAPAGRRYALGAACLLADAHAKAMAPGTDVWEAVVGLR